MLSPRTRPEFFPIRQSIHLIQCRTQATAAATIDHIEEASDLSPSQPAYIPEDVLTRLPSPPIEASRTSAKLAALHARLSLPSRLPIETLARTLVDQTADHNPKFNNSSFSVLGNDLLAYYTSEYIICQYPRLPLAVVFAAMYAYCGPKALATITREWGVQPAAAPGGEVDPGFLQFMRLPPEPQPERLGPELVSTQSAMVASPNNPNIVEKRRRSISNRTVYDDEFGEPKSSGIEQSIDLSQGVTMEKASANFVRAVIGAVYLHAGRAASKQFYKDHFMSRQLNMASLFQFRTPTKDLSKLCAREGFQPPIARILSETGRLSRHPVFVVGVFSGKEKLGEGAGSSLDEARTRAAVAALKSWYLYSPLDWKLPSDTEEANAKQWVPQMVDQGDVVV